MSDIADQLRAQLPTVIAEIAAHMGEGWRAEGEGYMTRLVGPDDAAFVFYVEYNSRGAVKITGRYPDQAREMYDVTYPSINVNANRGGATIAREINRRLMPGYLTELARVKEWIARDSALKDVQRVTADELALATGVAYRKINDTYEFRYYRSGGLSLNFEVTHGGSVRLDRVYGEADAITAGILAMLAVDRSAGES